MGSTEVQIDPARLLEDVEMRVDTVVDVEDFPEARKDVHKPTIDFGDETRQSVAGLTDDYDKEALQRNQVIAVVNLGTVAIADFESECLVTGVDDDEGVIHLTTERDVGPGSRVY